MSPGLAEALALPGLPVVLGAMALAGLVYGFAGFGAALVFLPLAATVVPPVVAVGLMGLSAVGSAMVVLPRAWRQAERRQVLWSLVPALAMLPLGVWVLGRADVTLLRWVMTGVVAVTLVALVLGWRRRLPATRATLMALGVGAGGLGGATGLHGPIMILFTLSGSAPAQVMRANLLVFLTTLGTAMVPVLAAQGFLTRDVLWLGLLAAPVYLVAVWAGQAVFDPRHARLWRWTGYVVVAGAVVAGLPLWG